MTTYVSRQDPDPDLAGSVTNSTTEYGSEKNINISGTLLSTIRK